MRKLLALILNIGAVVTIAVAGSTPAFAIIIEGIDFGALGDGGVRIGTATMGQTFVNSVGDTQTAYGLVSTINGSTTYCADGSANCALYYVATSTVSATPDASTLYGSGTQVTVYYSGAPAINTLNQSSAANLGFITSLTPWATLNGENGVDPTAAGLTSDQRQKQALVGASISLGGSGLLSIDTADGLGLNAAEAFLNANTIPTFTGAFADVVWSTSANNLVLNPFDVASAGADSCQSGNPQVGDYCLQGSANFLATAVTRAGPPAPGTFPPVGAVQPGGIGGIDFGVLGASQLQLGTATLAQTFVNSVGDTQTAYGLVSTINGSTTYCADGSANCALYYVATSTVSATPDASTLYGSGTQLTIYYSDAPAVNTLNQSSAANLGFITSLTPWATLNGENGIDPTAAGLTSDQRQTQALSGATISLFGSGLLSIDTTDGMGLTEVELFLDANTIPTFTGAFADVEFNTSGNNLLQNPFDVASAGADSCQSGNPQVGDYCFQGSADYRGMLTAVPPGATVPLPGKLALVGLGLLGLRAVRWKGW